MNESHDLKIRVQTATELLRQMQPPVVVVSTKVGRGMYTQGEAIVEQLANTSNAVHVAIEKFLPERAVSEDLARYRWISNRIPLLLNLVYRVPIFYYRKYLREKMKKGFDLQALKCLLEERGPASVICISHRPAFWVSSLKLKTGQHFQLWGVLGEYGNTLGWRYIFWNQMNGFFSPLPASALSYPFPKQFVFCRCELPARREYYELGERAGDPDSALLVCGYWGQGPFVKIVRILLQVTPPIRINVVCGENKNAYQKLSRVFGNNYRVTVHAEVSSLKPFMAEASVVITKPGISTLLEAHAAGRKIMLLRGMPVAEDNNALYAIANFGAEWFSLETLTRWRHSGSSSPAKTVR